MRRSILLTTAVLGAVLSLVGMTGVFAPFTDTASVGTEEPNRFGSAARLREADLVVAPVAPRTGCGEFVQDIAVGTIQVTDAARNDPFVQQFCVRNEGAAPVALEASVTDIVDVELACTGNEADVDTTCAPGAEGELSGTTIMAIYPSDFDVDCTTDLVASSDFNSLGGLRNRLGTLQPGATACIQAEIMDNSGINVLSTQSDETSFRIDFEGTTTS